MLHSVILASSDPLAAGLIQAGGGEILVSRTVRDLAVGPGTGFEDRGSVELRGVPGTWQLLAVVATARGPDRPRRNWRQRPLPDR
jgi:class 3 adenylate cyclase